MTPAAGKWKGRKKKKLQMEQVTSAKWRELSWLQVTTDGHAAVIGGVQGRDSLPNQLMDDFVCKGYRKRNRRKKSIFDFDL